MELHVYDIYKNSTIGFPVGVELCRYTDYADERINIELHSIQLLYSRNLNITSKLIKRKTKCFVCHIIKLCFYFIITSNPIEIKSISPPSYFPGSHFAPQKLKSSKHHLPSTVRKLLTCCFEFMECSFAIFH